MKTFYQYIQWMRKIHSDYYYQLLVDEELRIRLKTIFINLENELKK